MSNSKYIVAAPDELYHFKYIKRIQGPDGKWRYYYGTSQDHKKIRGASMAGQGYSRAGRNSTLWIKSAKMTNSELAKRGRRAQATMDQYEVHNVARRSYTNAKRKIKARVADIKARIKNRSSRGTRRGPR